MFIINLPLNVLTNVFSNLFLLSERSLRTSLFSSFCSAPFFYLHKLQISLLTLTYLFWVRLLKSHREYEMRFAKDAAYFCLHWHHPSIYIDALSTIPCSETHWDHNGEQSRHAISFRGTCSLVRRHLASKYIYK